MKKKEVKNLTKQRSCPRCGGLISINKKGFCCCKKYFIRCNVCFATWEDPLLFFSALRAQSEGVEIGNSWPIPSSQPISLPSSKVLDLVKNLPKESSIKDLVGSLETILTEIKYVRRKDMPLVYEAINLLKAQPNIIEAITEKYRSLSINNYKERRQLISLTGELKKLEAMPLLHSIVDARLPSEDKSKNKDHRLTPRQREEIIQAKAIEGIGYLQNEIENKYLIEIMENHESDHIRITAIDSYMWNHEDNEETVQILNNILPEKFLKYVKRPRFYHGMNVQDFNSELLKWLEKWGE